MLLFLSKKKQNWFNAFADFAILKTQNYWREMIM